MREKSISNKYFFRKLEGKRPLPRTRGKWNLFKSTKRGMEIVDWFNFARERNQCWDIGKWNLFKCTKRGKGIVDWLNMARDTSVGIYLLPERLSDPQDELWLVVLVQHVELLWTVQSTLVCVNEGCTHTMTSRDYQTSQFEHGAFSTACLGVQNPHGGLPPLYNENCGGRGRGKATRTGS